MDINAKNINSLSNSVRVLFNKALSETSANYEKIAMRIPSNTRETTYAWMGQIPNMREWIGDREIQNLASYDYTIKNKTFELTTSIPVNDVADDLYGVYRPVFSEMGASAKKHPDTLVFGLLSKGFEKDCYDGVPYFSDSHPVGRGNVTQSNIGHKKLSAESYAEARSSMMIVKGDHGRSLNIMPDLLVVAPQKEAKARELLFADIIAGSTNINKNTCDLLVAPELADYPERWFLFCTKRYVKPIIFQEREKAILVCKNKETDDNVFYEDKIIYGVKARYNVGFGLWQLAFGSDGTIDSDTTTEG